jgi:hypothetical protein
MERVVERSNLWLAYQRVVQNKGAPGVDGLTVAEFKDWLKVHWPSVREALLEGRGAGGRCPIRSRISIPCCEAGSVTSSSRSLRGSWRNSTAGCGGGYGVCCGGSGSDPEPGSATCAHWDWTRSGLGAVP